MKPKPKLKATYSLVMFGLLAAHSAWAETSTASGQSSVISDSLRQGWFEHLRDNLLTHFPQPGSDIETMDRLITHQIRSTPAGPRRDLATQDAKQREGNINHQYETFLENALGKGMASTGPGSLLKDNSDFKSLAKILDDGTRAKNARNRVRSMDFILKDLRKRSRPRYALDADGNFVPGYTDLNIEEDKKNSFPSGHTWNGYKNAFLMAMIFPERGEESYARALQYGESRVVLGAHFATDTIASRIGVYYLTAQMLADDEIATNIALTAKAARQSMATACGGIPLRHCLEALPTSVADEHRAQQDRIGYYGVRSDTSNTPLAPSALPAQAPYLLRLRFPYLNQEDWRDILAGSAYPQDSIAGMLTPGSTWGLLNMPGAYRGPAHFYRDMDVNQQAGNPYDIAGFGEWDIWKNDIAGPGGLIKRGDGTLVLTGNNTYAGATTVNGGALIVNGSLSSNVTVNNTGTLGGNGTLKNLRIGNGGTLSPGNSIGRLTVTDNLVLDPGARFRVEANASGQMDQVKAGNAAINGGTVQVLADRGRYNRYTNYAIIQADTRNGAFADVTSNLAFLTPTLSYTDKQVVLTLTRNHVKYTDLAATRNQMAVGRALDRMSHSTSQDSHDAINTIDSLSAPQARAALAVVHGAGLVSAQQAGAAFSNSFGNQLRGRLSIVSNPWSNRTAAQDAPIMLAANDNVDDLMQSLQKQSKFSLNGGVPDGQGNQAGLWLRRYGSQQNTGGDAENAASRLRDGGTSIGFDAQVATDLVVGIAFNHGNSDLSTDDAVTGRSRGNAAALYAGYATGNWNLSGSFNIARNSNHTERRMAFGSLQQTAIADFHSRSLSLYGETTYDIPMSNWILRPLAGLSWTHGKTDGFTESGAPGLNLQVNPRSEHSVKTLLGTKAVLAVGDNILLQPRLIWSHDFGNANAPMTSQFQDSGITFSTYGAEIPRDALIGGLTLSGQANSHLSLFADAQVQYNSRQSNLGFLVGIRSSW
ncbi:autotransporter domain-containing protein [Herbaspirillum sp. SJZ099]|uniref:autotransporter domain-containing protein n=1 Tax=Herbaspirillum sp. SJZ099 TaxID=2572916 RepID=UPI0011A66281|nr:autotransporter domain-containing protein [Herbaspirillum sp. SJZ099]